MLTALHSAQIVGVVTLLMVLRDMGNGVIRLECARLLGLADPVCNEEPDSHPMVFPPSPAVADCLEIARCAAGVSPCHRFTEGRCRLVCDGVREYRVW